jgi:hypothetical protein
MQRKWTAEEISEQWTLLPEEAPWLANKSGATRLGFAVLLKFFQIEGRFPRQAGEIPAAAIEYLAQQVSVAAVEWLHYDWDSRAAKYHRTQIRGLLGFREATAEDSRALAAWLCEHVLARDRQQDRLRVAVLERCRALHIEPPTPERIERLIRSALYEFERQFCEELLRQLPAETRMQLEDLLLPAAPLFAEPGQEPGRAPLHELREGPGPGSLKSVGKEIGKLNRIRALRLPPDLFVTLSLPIVRSYYQRVLAEEPHELRRHPEPLRATLLAAYCYLRSQAITDHLVDLLIDTVHRIGAKAERRVERELIEDLKRITGKTGLLYRLAEAALAHPEGTVKEVLFPVVDEQTLRDLVREGYATGPVYRQQLQTVIRNSYRWHYRQMLPAVLATLEFRSNNARHRPVIRALALLRKYASTKVRLYPLEEVPLEGVVRSAWLDAVQEKDRNGNVRINRIAYEICVLQALREQLRYKEIWVVGADRYRNPEEDLPLDFDTQRDVYYEALRLPLEAKTFVSDLRRGMRAALETLDRGLPQNPPVKILEKAHGWISLSPLEAQPEPTGLTALKAELGSRWPMTSLLDVLKETELRVGFTEVFRSPTPYETLDRALLRERLLLSLHGLGTNTGLKRMAAGQPATSYKDLLYIRRRFITREHLREAIRRVVNATFRVRLPESGVRARRPVPQTRRSSPPGTRT